MRSRCIRCCISMKLALPMPSCPIPAIPPKPPRPKGDWEASGGGAVEELEALGDRVQEEQEAGGMGRRQEAVGSRQ